MASSTNTYTSPLGLVIFKPDWAEDFTITGYPSKEYCMRDFDSAYEFEDFVKEKVPTQGITFDSESCQFFAYAKSSTLAMRYVKSLEDYFQRVSSLLKTNAERSEIN